MLNYRILIVKMVNLKNVMCLEFTQKFQNLHKKYLIQY